MTAMTITKAEANLVEAVEQVADGGERVTLKRAGKPMAAIVSVDDLALLEAIEDELDVSDAKKARRHQKKIPWNNLKANTT